MIILQFKTTTKSDWRSTTNLQHRLNGKPGIKMDKRNMNYIMKMIYDIGYMVNLHGNAGMEVDKSAMKHIMNMGS